MGKLNSHLNYAKWFSKKFSSNLIYFSFPTFSKKPNGAVFLFFKSFLFLIYLIYLIFSLVLAFKAVFHTHSCIFSHFFSQFWHSKPPFCLVFIATIIFSLVLAFRAVVHIHLDTLNHHLSVFLTSRVISPQLYHSESQSQAFVFIGIVHLAFTALHLSSFSSPCYPVLIAYSSPLFQISLSFEFMMHISIVLLGTMDLAFSYSSHRAVSFECNIFCTSEWFDHYLSLIWSFKSLLETS